MIDEIKCPKCGSKEYWEQQYGSSLTVESDDHLIRKNVYVCQNWIATEDGEILCFERYYL